MGDTFVDMFNDLAGHQEPASKPDDLALPEPVDVSVPPPERRQAQLAKVEERLYEKVVTLLDASVSTFELSDAELQAPAPPPRWVRELGEDKALERWNIAKNARLSKKDAPIAFDLGAKVHTTISRARSLDKQRAMPLNAVVVHMTLAEPPKFEEREVVDTTAEDDWGDAP